MKFVSQSAYSRRVLSVKFVSLGSALYTAELCDPARSAALPQLSPEVFNNSVVAVSGDQPVRGRALAQPVSVGEEHGCAWPA